MKTANIDFIRGVYEKTSINELGTKIDFKRTTPANTNEPLLTEIIRLEFDNGFHDRSLDFDYWIYFKQDFWNKSVKTGLANSKINTVFFGDITRELNLSVKNDKGKNHLNPQHLIIAHSLNVKDCLTIDLFENFYVKPKIRDIFIKDHYMKHIYKKRAVNTAL